MILAACGLVGYIWGFQRLVELERIFFQLSAGPVFGKQSGKFVPIQDGSEVDTP